MPAHGLSCGVGLTWWGGLREVAEGTKAQAAPMPYKVAASRVFQITVSRGVAVPAGASTKMLRSSAQVLCTDWGDHWGT